MSSLKDFKNQVVAIFQNKEITPTEQSMLIAITLLCDNDQNVCFASNHRLGTMLNLSEKRVSTIINQLKNKQQLTIQYFAKGTSLTVNQKRYRIFRLLKPQLTMTINSPASKQQGVPQSEEGSTPVSEETLSPNLGTKPTNKKNTKVIQTNTHSKTASSSKSQMHQSCLKVDHANPDEREMYQHAWQITLAHPNVINQELYTARILQNWHQQGLHTLEAVYASEQRLSVSSPKIIQEKVPTYVQNTPITQSQPTTEAPAKIMQDIVTLEKKLGMI